MINFVPRLFKLPSIRLLAEFVPERMMLDLMNYAAVTYLITDGMYADGSADDELRVTEHWGGLNMDYCKRKLQGAGVIGAVERHIARTFNAEPMPTYSSFRRVRDDATYIKWHSDADGAGSRSQGDVWNCWIPLANCGVTLPSLEIVANSEAYVRANPKPESSAHFTTPEVKELFGNDPYYCPVMDIGDALLFSHWLVHRTQSLPRPWHGERIGAEFRFKPRRWLR